MLEFIRTRAGQEYLCNVRTIAVSLKRIARTMEEEKKAPPLPARMLTGTCGSKIQDVKPPLAKFSQEDWGMYAGAVKFPNGRNPIMCKCEAWEIVASSQGCEVNLYTTDGDGDTVHACYAFHHRHRLDYVVANILVLSARDVLSTDPERFNQNIEALVKLGLERVI